MSKSWGPNYLQLKYWYYIPTHNTNFTYQFADLPEIEEDSEVDDEVMEENEENEVKEIEDDEVKENEELEEQGRSIENKCTSKGKRKVFQTLVII